MHARIEGDVITEVGTPPNPWWNGTTWQEWTEGDLGWYTIVTTSKPEDTAAEIYESSIGVVDGVPTEVWIARPRTSEELQEWANEANRVAIEEGLRASLVDLQTLIDTTNATINTSPAVYIKILARILRRVIRMILRSYDSTT